MTKLLTLADISDLRAYERERPDFLKEVIALKAKRRIGIGPFITVVFENTTTVRFQIQEMARAEKMLTDEQIQTEIDIYNPLIAGPGELSMTLFVELTSEAQLREWLPKLAGIERSIVLRVGEGDLAVVVPAVLDAAHASQLTRDEITASVHYLKITLPEDLQDNFLSTSVAIASILPAYEHGTVLGDATKGSLASDWIAE